MYIGSSLADSLKGAFYMKTAAIKNVPVCLMLVMNAE